jgi:ABC-type uncharacterized transport system permease subunit
MILASSAWWNPLSTAIPSLGAALGYALLAAYSARMGRNTLSAIMALVWLLHGLSLVSVLTMEPIRFGFAPLLSVTAWLVFTIYAIETRLYPQLGTRWTLAGLGAPAVLLVLAFPGAIYPVLPSSWMPLHWALGIASYGMVGIAVAHAWMMQHTERLIRKGTPAPNALPLLTLERLTFRFVFAAFVLLTLTLLAGWAFSLMLTTTGWAWTHKTVFTVLSWLILGVLLLGRRLQGWRGRLAVRMLYVSAGLLVLGYVGSRFVIEVILQRP